MSRLYVGRLPNSAREKDVEKFFKGYGKINEIVLKNGYGFVVSNWCQATLCITNTCKECLVHYRCAVKPKHLQFFIWLMTSLVLLWLIHVICQMESCLKAS